MRNARGKRGTPPPWHAGAKKSNHTPSMNPPKMNPQKLRRHSAALSDTNTIATGATAPARFAKALVTLAATAAALCALMTFAPATANAADATATSPKWFADLGWLTQVSGVTAMGVNLRGGYYLNDDNRLTLDVGFAFDISPKVVGHFSYGPPGNTNQKTGDFDYNRDFIPLMIGWEHEWKTANDKLTWRLGPTVGAAFVSAAIKDDPHTKDSPSKEASQSATAFLGGLNAGLRWMFIPSVKNLYLDFSLAALFSNAVKLDQLKGRDAYNNRYDATSEKVNLSGGRLIIAVGYRF